MSASVASKQIQPKPWFPMTHRILRRVGKYGVDIFELIGQAGINTWTSVRFLVKGNVRFQHTVDQAAFVGFETFGIAFILTTFSGMVIALQMAPTMTDQGAGPFVGALISMAILREIAPIMSGFAVIALAGSAFSAELATMKVTNQVDALIILHVSPIRYLVLPRMLATMIMLPVLTLITAVCGVLGGLLVTLLTTDITMTSFMDSVLFQTEQKDVLSCLSKALVFGYVISILSTTIGLQARGGAKEVGNATTKAVVWSFVVMAICDYLLTYLIYGTT